MPDLILSIVEFLVKEQKFPLHGGGVRLVLLLALHFVRGLAYSRRRGENCSWRLCICSLLVDRSTEPGSVSPS